MATTLASLPRADSWRAPGLRVDVGSGALGGTRSGSFLPISPSTPTHTGSATEADCIAFSSSPTDRTQPASIIERQKDLLRSMHAPPPPTAGRPACHEEQLIARPAQGLNYRTQSKGVDSFFQEYNCGLGEADSPRGVELTLLLDGITAGSADVFSVPSPFSPTALSPTEGAGGDLWDIGAKITPEYAVMAQAVGLLGDGPVEGLPRAASCSDLRSDRKRRSCSSNESMEGPGGRKRSKGTARSAPASPAGGVAAGAGPASGMAAPALGAPCSPGNALLTSSPLSPAMAGPDTPEPSGEGVGVAVGDGGSPAVASRPPLVQPEAGGLAGQYSGATAPGIASKGIEKKPAAPKRKKRRNSTRCLNCGAHTTPQWRAGPHGPKTLCNACGVRHKKGLELVPTKGGADALEQWELSRMERDAALLGSIKM